SEWTAGALTRVKPWHARRPGRLTWRSLIRVAPRGGRCRARASIDRPEGSAGVRLSLAVITGAARGRLPAEEDAPVVGRQAFGVGGIAVAPEEAAQRHGMERRVEREDVARDQPVGRPQDVRQRL